METSFRFSMEHIEIECEGSEDFVRSEMKPFLAYFSAGTRSAPAEETDPDSLLAWYGNTIPPGQTPTMQDHILVFAYFLNRKKRQFIFTPDDMKAAFDEVGRTVPKSLLQIMGSLKRDHQQLYSGDKRGEYCLTPSGLKYVERLLGIGKPEDAAREPAPVPEAVPGQAGQVPSEAPGNRQYTRSIFGGEDGNE